MTTEPIIKVLTLNCAPDVAFERFTAKIDKWWPVQTHSVSAAQGAKPDLVVFEAKVGGRIYEVKPDGSECVWGTVEICHPPNKLAFTWHPGRPSEESTQVSVHFEQDGTKTRMTLQHGGWDKLADGSARRTNYVGGWDLVLGGFTKDI